MNYYYKNIGRECEIFKSCFLGQIPLLIRGPTGCGKSQFVMSMAEEFNRPLIKVACNEDTSAADLLGRFIIKNMETVWQDGPVTRAIRTGAILYLDEIAEAREDVIVAIHPLTDHRRELYIDRTNEALVAPKEFMCIASFNPGYQKGFKELKPSTRQRFVTIDLNYPDKETEIEIIQKITNVDKVVAGKLVDFAGKVRAQPTLGLKETISTRLIIRTAELIKQGMAPRQACQFGIINCLTDDTKIISALVDLMSLHF